MSLLWFFMVDLPKFVSIKEVGFPDTLLEASTINRAEGSDPAENHAPPQEKSGFLLIPR